MKTTMSQVFVPIAIYRLSGDKKWTAEALGFEGAVTDGNSQAEARTNLTSVLQNYLAMLDADDPFQAVELDYLQRLTAPPEGVEWMSLSLPLTTTSMTAGANNGSRQQHNAVSFSRQPKRKATVAMKLSSAKSGRLRK